MPPEYLQPILHSIESAVVNLYKEMPYLLDKDVEFAYSKLEKYYSDLAKGKKVDEPEVASDKKQAIIDEVLNALDIREELRGDIHLVNQPENTNYVNYPSLPSIYVKCFKILITSVRNWRKRNGVKGYLNFVKNHVL
ncbi:MAG: hypothetical protein AB8G11_00240 [Saprospiraceae bacterium]